MFANEQATPPSLEGDEQVAEPAGLAENEAKERFGSGAFSQVRSVAGFDSVLWSKFSTVNPPFSALS